MIVIIIVIIMIKTNSINNNDNIRHIFNFYIITMGMSCGNRSGLDHISCQGSSLDVAAWCTTRAR